MSGSRKNNQEIYGETRYGPAKNGNIKRWDATRKVKESVKNASEKKSEFLKKLQELEQISVRKKSKEEQEEVDGMIHFTENQFYKKEDSLHEDLQLIEKALLKVSMNIIAQSPIYKSLYMTTQYRTKPACFRAPTALYSIRG